MIDTTQPLLVHDTVRVMYANASACALFGCDVLVLTSRDVLDLVISEDFKTLVQVHMRILRERGDAPEIEYPFLRCNLTVFYAKVASEQLEQGRFSMTFTKTFEWW